MARLAVLLVAILAVHALAKHHSAKHKHKKRSGTDALGRDARTATEHSASEAKEVRAAAEEEGGSVMEKREASAAAESDEEEDVAGSEAMGAGVNLPHKTYVRSQPNWLGGGNTILPNPGPSAYNGVSQSSRRFGAGTNNRVLSNRMDSKLAPFGKKGYVSGGASNRGQTQYYGSSGSSRGDVRGRDSELHRGIEYKNNPHPAFNSLYDDKHDWWGSKDTNGNYKGNWWSNRHEDGVWDPRGESDGDRKNLAQDLGYFDRPDSQLYGVDSKPSSESSWWDSDDDDDDDDDQEYRQVDNDRGWFDWGNDGDRQRDQYYANAMATGLPDRDSYKKRDDCLGAWFGMNCDDEETDDRGLHQQMWEDEDDDDRQQYDDRMDDVSSTSGTWGSSDSDNRKIDTRDEIHKDSDKDFGFGGITGFFRNIGESFGMNDCRTTVLGTDYKGRQYRTVAGYTCQRWDLQTPHSHVYRDDDFPFDSVLADARNYCRNPKGEAHGLWCYTDDKKMRWDYCDIPMCGGRGVVTEADERCRKTMVGALYSGSMNITRNSRACQRWDSDSPHVHITKAKDMPERSLTDSHNYCRNPSKDKGGPWCYTQDLMTRWDYCDVPVCPGYY